MRSTFIVIIALALLSSCSLFKGKKKEGDAIARVYDKYLYSDELKGLIPPQTAPKDSIEITRTYINNWIRQELLLHQAENNLDDEQMDFEKQVEQYRNSLIIFKYESELVRQKLDTAVSMAEIETYYKENQGNFQLHENILRTVFITLNKNSTSAPRLRQLLRSTREADHDKLTQLCQQEAVEFHLDDQSWMSFAEFATKVPLTVSDQQEFLNKNPYFEVQDSVNRYFVSIKEYKIKESVSPLSFEVNNIRAILLNKRKSEMLTRMEEDLYKAALGKKNFEIY